MKLEGDGFVSLHLIKKAIHFQDGFEFKFPHVSLIYDILSILF